MMLRLAGLARLRCGWLLLAAAGGAATAGDHPPPRTVISLNGGWEFRRDQGPSNEWKTVQVPSAFQDHEGTEFHGVGWYRKQLQPFTLPPGKHALIQFQAAATEAEVWLDGRSLGKHLGGWTPFRFDITELVRHAPPNTTHELLVWLDEKVGHNTQGFLPIIAPHFGGLWQEVKLLIVPELYVDDLATLAMGDAAEHELRLEVPLAGALPSVAPELSLRTRLRGRSAWQNLAATVARSNATLFVRAPLPKARRWSPVQPDLYDVELKLPGAEGDVWQTRAAFRSFEAAGSEFRLNGQALNLRGVLNWGYSPPRIAPNPGEAAWRAELEFARSHGFNLMKFCLWIPPARYLELCDELGMLAWVEYPTWHPALTAKYLEPLRREYGEFFRYDRNHPAIVLRSLTCETGPSAQLEVIRSLYDLCHQMVPGAVVEDDSSWISWNRVNDFYDDHPYGNNHTWVNTLAGFKRHITANGIKPFILGEAIAADTWLDRPAVVARLGSERPWWAPGPLDEIPKWQERMTKIAGPDGLEQLGPDSLRYGLLMRKYQIEAFRRELPQAGYVVSVIRDIPNASMGLLDYCNRSKWTPAQWSWQRDTICLLKTEADRRAFAARETFPGELLVSHFGPAAIEGGELTVTLAPRFPAAGKPVARAVRKGIRVAPGTLTSLVKLDWVAPAVAQPTPLRVQAQLRSRQGIVENEWPIWAVPAVAADSLREVAIHPSLSRALRAELFPGCPNVATNPAPGAVVVAGRFDDELVRLLEAGGRVLFLPDGERNSLPLSDHWFLRGAPYIPAHALASRVPRDFFVELQHFDLAGPVVPNLPLLESFDPILLLWDTHDLKTVKTHGVIFETKVGEGRLLVSTARHTGTNNPAGRWLLAELLGHLRGEAEPSHKLPAEAWAYLKSKLHADQTNLVSRTWKFHPDPKNEGLALGWHKPGLAGEADWADIHIGTWWENQGYPDLDGWAWYRLQVDIPKAWEGSEVFLSFEGVDDIYELYVNGEIAGKGGDLATHQDALTEKKSHNITDHVKPGQPTTVAVRVHDWYGAGGIFRPVTLGTVPFNPALDLLK
jgi:hypothetical protein